MTEVFPGEPSPADPPCSHLANIVLVDKPDGTSQRVDFYALARLITDMHREQMADAARITNLETRLLSVTEHNARRDERLARLELTLTQVRDTIGAAFKVGSDELDYEGEED